MKSFDMNSFDMNSSKNNPSKSDTFKTEFSKTDSSKTVFSKTESSKTDFSKTGSSKTASYESNPAGAASSSGKDLICIVCPRGCRLTARQTPEGLKIEGNFCPRGEEYARQELTNPVRVLTALMRVDGADRPVSVKTDRPVPKALLFDCVQQIYRTHPKAPVRRGDVLLRDVCGTGCNVVATRDA